MSAVRMCDQDGTLFSERQEGWTTMQAARMVKRPDGSRVQLIENLDLCPGCSLKADEVAPQLAITPTATAPKSTVVDAEVSD